MGAAPTGDDADGSRVPLPGPDGVHVDARLRADGALVLQGQLLRPGMAEYEYVVTLPADQVPALCRALGLAHVDALLPELVRRGAEITPSPHTWLRGLGLQPELWAHLGD